MASEDDDRYGHDMGPRVYYAPSIAYEDDDDEDDDSDFEMLPGPPSAPAPHYALAPLPPPPPPVIKPRKTKPKVKSTKAKATTPALTTTTGTTTTPKVAKKPKEPKKVTAKALKAKTDKPKTPAGAKAAIAKVAAAAATTKKPTKKAKKKAPIVGGPGPHADFASASSPMSPPLYAPPGPPPPMPALPRPTRMLSMFELCHNDDDAAEHEPHHPPHGRPVVRYADDDARFADDTSSVDENASMVDSESGSIKTPPKKRIKNTERNGEDVDEGWSDHNRWYCNICKDGGELLCCDRCPRAFHMSCLGMHDTAIPDTEWYCKMCTECLDRRRLKKENREKARLVREAEKLERDAKKLQLQEKKEELLAEKNAKAIESKAKRVLEMQDRILSRKKIKYKDKEEEKLGKLAEDLAQSVRTVKEKLEKLEKEDAALKKKEESMNKKKKAGEDLAGDVTAADKPSPSPCTFGGIPEAQVSAFLAIWDCLNSFSDILQLAPITHEELAAALAYPEVLPIVTEVHMCLLDLILEDREEEDYVSDDEAAMDESERFRFEIQHAPITVGVPTSNLLNSVSWPSILYNLIMSVPRYTYHVSPLLKDATLSLNENEYSSLKIEHKLALLGFLVSRVYCTEKIRHMLGKHAGEGLTLSKEFNRAQLQDRKMALEDEKKLREKQRAELSDLAEKGKGSMKNWLKNEKRPTSNGASDVASVDGDDDDKKNDNYGGNTGSDSELDELTEEALAKNEEDLERLQIDGFISRHEYLARKKQLDAQREKLRRRAEEKQRKQKTLEQLERKRIVAKKGIQDALVSKDAALLKIALEKARECELPEKIIVSASHVLEMLEAEAQRDEEAESRKKKYNLEIRAFFVRTESLGRDKSDMRYWIFRGDHERLYVERPGSFSLRNHYDEGRSRTSQELNLSSSWFCYVSEAEVKALIDALDERHPRELALRVALKENFEIITDQMPTSKPGLLISDLQNEGDARKRTKKQSEPDQFLAWRNEKRTWRKKNHLHTGIDAFREDIIEVEVWLSTRLKELGSNWAEVGRPDWAKSVKAMKAVEDGVGPLLALENEVMTFHVRAQKLLAGSEDQNKPQGTPEQPSTRVDTDKSDDEDEDDDEDLDETADDGTILWPTTKCRERWIAEVKRARTLATLSAALGCFVQRLELFGLTDVSLEDASSITTRRAKTEKEKRSRKERAVNKKLKKEEAEEDEEDAVQDRNSVDDWEEDCYICTEGGEVLCCDGCPRVFHYPCVGLRRVPRGKTFCHHCDTSVKPVFPAIRGTPRVPVPVSRTTVEADVGTPDDDGSDVELTIDTKSLNAATKHSEDQWDVECGVCRLGGELLCCDGCPRAFHTKCIGIVDVPDDEWFCNECNLQTCGGCKKNKIRLDAHVICGNEEGTKGCERVFHLKCAKLSAVPEDDWYCKKCRKLIQN